MGIPFWWVAEHCLPMWAVGVGVLLLMFFVLDYRDYLAAPKSIRAGVPGPDDAWRFEGLANVFFLAIILAAVFVHNPPFLREGLMVLAALGSYSLTSKSIHESNHFNFHPLQEVAILFIGIFATMMPALDWLQGNASTLANVTNTLLYWGSGSLSSALDNAPTYLCFLKAIASHFVNADAVAQVHQLIQAQSPNLAGLTGPHAEEIRQTFLALQKYHAAALAGSNVSLDQIQTAYLLGNLKLNSHILAISIGSVFFGANTYIGNGPNFMVKSIADHQKVPTPGFLGYIVRFTIPCMLPTLLIVWWIFFRQ